MAGAEDEIGSGSGLRGDTGVVGEDEQAAIQALAQLDAAAGVGARSGQLHPAGAEMDGIVPGDRAGIATAQHRRQIARRGAPGGRGLRGGAGEAGVKVDVQNVPGGGPADLLLGVLAPGGSLILISSAGALTFSGPIGSLSALPTETVLPDFHLSAPGFLQFTFPSSGVPATLGSSPGRPST